MFARRARFKCCSVYWSRDPALLPSACRPVGFKLPIGRWTGEDEANFDRRFFVAYTLARLAGHDQGEKLVREGAIGLLISHLSACSTLAVPRRPEGEVGQLIFSSRAESQEVACALEALSARGHSEAIVLEGGIPVLASLVRNGCCDGGLRQTETVWVGTALNGERVTTSTFWWGAAQQAASALVTLAYRGHADDVVREGAIAPLIALLRVSADGDLRGKQSTPPFWDEYWRDRERGCQPSGLAGWRRGYGSAAGALSALAAASEEFAAAIVAAGGMCFVLPRDGDGDGDDDDDARMAEDATPPATAGGCVAAFSEDFGFAAASVAK